MILRRVIEHVKAQNWTAVALDFVIVVMGVFIGIQVSNLNEARSDRLQETEYLAALEVDVATSLESLATQITALERQQEARRTLYEYSRNADAIIDGAELDQLLSYGLFNLSNTNISQVTFETLKSSGRLSLIRSPQLVAELQALSAEHARVMGTQADNLQIVYLFSDPLLIGEGDVENLMLAPNINEQPDGSAGGDDALSAVPWISGSKEGSLPPDVIKSTRFKNIVLYRAEIARIFLNALRRLEARHRKIATLIDARQTELGVN